MWKLRTDIAADRSFPLEWQWYWAHFTMEIMLGGAMLFNFDFRGADIVAVVLSFMVLYFAVVALLTDK